MPRTRIGVRLSPEQKARLKEAADRERLTISGYIVAMTNAAVNRHKSRLDRDFSGSFGDQAYAAEELVAELTCAFVCAALGIQGELRHAGYIQSWLKLLKSDKRAIFTAASKATAAADFLLSFSAAAKAETAE